jgi:uncharacterized protein
VLVIHIIGLAFLYGRWLHAQGLLKDNLRYRVRGMGFTLTILLALSVANIVLAAFNLVKTQF